MATNATKENEKGDIGERNERQRAMPGIKEREAVSVCEMGLGRPRGVLMSGRK